MRLLGQLIPDRGGIAERLVLLSEEEYQTLMGFVGGTYVNDDIPILKGLRRRLDLAKLVKHLETLTEVLARQESAIDASI